MTKKTKSLISEAYKNPEYSGKHIIIVGGKIHARKTGSAKSKLLEKLIKDYPEETPIIAYIPKEDTLIFGQYPRLQSGVKNEKRIPKEDTPLVATGVLKPPVAKPSFILLL